jgi:hypothetical protein
MSVPEILTNLVGSWAGTNRLWMMPDEPVHESDTTMKVALGERGGFATLQYTWTEDSKAQLGLLAIGPVLDENAVSGAWIDTFHTANSFMSLQGATGEDGNIVLKCSYPAPEGPDWGWQIRITPKPGDAFLFTMYNVSPEGEEYLAVEVTYFRKP